MTSSTKPLSLSPRATSWIIAAGALLFTLQQHLLLALLSGLLVHELVFLLEPTVLRINGLPKSNAKLIVVALIALVVIAFLIAIALSLAHFFQTGNETLPGLLTKMAEILNNAKASLPESVARYFPQDIDSLREQGIVWLREHANELQIIGKDAGRAAALILLGMIIGALIALTNTAKTGASKPFPAELKKRVATLSTTFRRVVFAQAYIAAINTLFTSIYLALALPLFGVHLPFLKTMILLTFLFGLLPVVGNLFSNTVIVVVSISYSFNIALISLAFLIAIHKTEYFLNARIIGARINAKAWELLIVMIAMEAVFGIAGVVAGPIFYAYLKAELADADAI